MQVSLNNLPSSVVLIIFKNLSVIDIISCCRSSVGWNKSVDNNRLWKSLYSHFFKDSPENIQNWRLLFSKRYFANRNMLSGDCTVSRLRVHERGVKGYK